VARADHIFFFSAIRRALTRAWTTCDRARKRMLRLATCAMLALAVPQAFAQLPAAQEYQVKAVFLFNFTQFVDWPADAFSDAQTPIVIGVLGDDPFGAYLTETVRGEKVNNRLLAVQRYRHVEDIQACHVLFISQSEVGHLDQIIAGLKNRSILTVSDVDSFARHGGMIRLVTENNHIRLRINVQAAKSAGLIISSKLLRAAEITGGKD